MLASIGDCISLSTNRYTHPNYRVGMHTRLSLDGHPAGKRHQPYRLACISRKRSDLRRMLSERFRWFPSTTSPLSFFFSVRSREPGMGEGHGLGPGAYM